ncbi:HAD-like domain-containing protein [Boeremia exigua]|uniref:HAD-like domain-containing protein n=1 Tax=Boeremia exigua TaxID=749465 RepID=UPI001E8D9E32|nr:HAD-like domain-containing protein [Boeremia exigua]KAH6633636.1 HAD-like domain-containing protein [Boeremia exigua]
MRPEAALIQLHEATWYAFDLDDTLHEFRKASAAAVKAVLKIIHETSGHTLEELDEEYKRVLSRGTALAFVDGKTSHQYREDRFQQLVRVFDIKLNEGQMQILVDLYEEVLTKSLELKPGVLELFQTLKRCGKKIAVITEGPQDAQERTVEALGLTSHIDYLATTNKLRVAKIDGLFSRVLEHLHLQPDEIIMTGDSWKRDIVPATQAGIYCIHYSEKGPEYDDSEKQRSIRTFGQLQDIIEKAHHNLEA